MAEEKQSIFRKKSVESIQSPEVLDDYVRVTSPGIWIFLGAVICLLIGVILWGVFGSIDSTVKVALISEKEQTVCAIPMEKADAVIAAGEVTADGETYALGAQAIGMEEVTAGMDLPVRVAGGFEAGTVVVYVPVKTTLPEGVVAGTVTTEKIKPITLLLQ